MIAPTAVEQAGFEILDTAPSGGTASVYKARHLSTGELCALKISERVTDLAVFTREASLLQQLSHPGIVRLLAHGTIDKFPYLATRWINGRRLTEIMAADTPLGLERALVFFGQIASALQHAHSQGVVHADVSPANIVVDASDKLSLIDFGISRNIDPVTATVDSGFSGTLRYVAPEIIKGEKASIHSDQYSLAILVYELISADWPYEGQSTAASALHHHLYSEPVSLLERSPQVPVQVSAALQKSLSKVVGERFESIDEMVNAITGSKPVAEPSPKKWYWLRFRECARVTGRAVSVIVLVMLVAGYVWQYDKSSEANPRLLFPVTHALEINPQCNLLATPTLDDAGIVENFYGVEGMRDRITLTSLEEDRWQLQIGKPNHYGLYGQIIAVQSALSYQFSANVQRQGYSHMPSLRVEWLDPEYQLLPDLVTEFRIDQIEDGHIEMPPVKVPPGAAFAVPTLYKDQTEGIMTVSAMNFFATDCQ